MCDNYSDNDISVRCFKNAGVFAARQLVFNLKIKDIRFEIGPLILTIMNNITLKKWANKLGSRRNCARNLQVELYGKFCIASFHR